MTATDPGKPWDFSQVLELVNSLQAKPVEPFHFDTKNNEKEYETVNGGESLSTSEGLGDFSKIFQYLGTPIGQKSSDFAVQPPSGNTFADSSHFMKDDYVSDGAAYSQNTKASSKTVQFEEQTSNEDQPATDAVSDSSLAPDTPLTKAQRKKRNRRERRAKEAAVAAERASRNAVTSISESEAEIAKKTPAKKASSHVIPTTPQSRYNLRQRDASGKAVTEVPATPDEDMKDAVNVAIQRLQSAKMAASNGDAPTQPPASEPTHIASDMRPSSWSNSYMDTSNKTGQHGYYSASNHAPTKLVPSSVQPPPNSTPKHFSSQYHANMSQALNARNPPNSIEPMTIRSGEDRHWALLMKLIREFYEDRRHLVAPMNLTTHNNDPNGIHVFVDASNIFIGFNEQLKISRGIHPRQQIPAADLSFDALALLIERRRPIAKRVLVGSTPHLPAFDKAKAVGYECNILEKVYKAKELTERRIYFRDLDRGKLRSRGVKAPPANNVATLNGSGNGSGSETNTPQYAPARMIEQGVDEILHLKILESVVDTDVPGTIVLATGDAAQAEYSEGFMAMAERALKKGWTVELVSWSKNISAMYTKRAWTEAWGARFRIIFLDDYAEELLDM